jgi:L-histidine Nalpha-methyltransferase
MQHVNIVHISDLHFSDDDKHRFSPPRSPSGHPEAGRHITLFDSLAKDLDPLTGSATKALLESGCDSLNAPTLLAITGDLTEHASGTEFKMVESFLERMTAQPLLRQTMSRQRVFLVPGNHDVHWNELHPDQRLLGYNNLYQRFKQQDSTPNWLEELNRVHDLSAECGVVIAELNSCAYVQQQLESGNRGEIDHQSLQTLRTQLTATRGRLGDRFEQCLRIAMIHHHPILIPALAEPGRGYDAVLNATYLLNILQDFGFHILLHGHKHNAHLLRYDVQPLGRTGRVYPEMVVVAGGSAGSQELPDAYKANSYNIISVKWNDATPIAPEIGVMTRCLVRVDREDRPLLPSDWSWRTRSYYGPGSAGSRLGLHSSRPPSAIPEPRELLKGPDGADWIWNFIGEDEIQELGDFLAMLRTNKRAIESGFSYWGIGPTLAWREACRDELYPVMRDGIESFSTRWGDLWKQWQCDDQFHYISLGIGDGNKDKAVLGKLLTGHPNTTYIPVDMSGEMLRSGVRNVLKARGLLDSGLEPSGIYPMQLDFSTEHRLNALRAFVTRATHNGRILIGLLGNTLANFEDDAELLALIAQCMRPEDRLLLELAWTRDIASDSVTSAAREYQASTRFCTFVTSALMQHTDFSVRNPQELLFEPQVQHDRIRINMYYQPLSEQRSRLVDGSEIVLEAGSKIRLYISRKYTDEAVECVASAAGLRIDHAIVVPLGRAKNFGLHLSLLSRIQ